MEGLLSSCVTTKNSATHLWKTPREECFYNINEVCGGFWAFYCSRVTENTEQQELEGGISTENLLWFSEVPRGSQAFLVDFKLSFLLPPNGYYEAEDFLGESFLEDLAREIQGYVNENFQGRLNDIQDIAVVSYSKPWVDNVSVNDRDTKFASICVRIQFPNIRIESKTVENHQEDICNHLKKVDITSSLPKAPLHPIENSILKRKADTPVLMYGSVSTEIRSPLSKFKIYDSGEGETELSLDELFFCDVHSNCREGFLDSEILREEANQNEYDDYLTPFFFSIEYPLSQISKRKTEFVREAVIKNDKHLDPRVLDDEGEFEMAQRFVKMLSPNRFLLKESDWLDIGKALYHSSKGSDRGVIEWIDSTRKILEQCQDDKPYFVGDNLEVTCRRQYDTFQREHVTVKTLAWFAAKDNKELYNNWHLNWMSSALENSVIYGGEEGDVAEVFYRRYWVNYAFDPKSSKGVWFRFKNHRWNEILQGIKGLRDVISREFIKIYERYNEQLTKQITQAEGDDAKAKLEAKVKTVLLITKKLKRSQFKNGMVKELSEKFVDEDFSKKRDANYFLTGTTNGILEVIDDRVIFRPGKPEDFVSMSTHIPYREDYSFNTPIVQECMKWFSMVYVDTEVRDFFLKFGASGLIGRNLTKNFFILCGEHGHNSKSMIVRGFEEAWGDYVFKIPVEALSQKYSDPSKPSPHLARCAGTRFAFTEEPEKTIELSPAVIKRYTGNDKVFARKLNENGGDLIMSFKTGMGTNDIPVISNPDPAIRKRVCIIPHDSYWCDDAPATFEEQMKLRRFPMDVNFEKRIPALAPAFLWIMVRYFPAFVKNFDQPALVKEKCQQYWLTKDLYAIYISERVQRRNPNMRYEENADKITLPYKDLYNDFKMWHRQNYSSSRTPDSGLAKSNFLKHLGRMIGGANSGVGSGWVGHSLVEEIENVGMGNGVLGLTNVQAQ